MKMMADTAGMTVESRRKNGPEGLQAAFADQFDRGNARFLALASAAAYRPKPRLNLNPPCEPLCIESAATSTRVLIWRLADNVIAAFRGTADLRNWLTDLDCEFVLENDCRIHAGFARALESVREKTLAGIFQAAQTCQGRPRLWLTGHSLGGALAMLFAWRVVERYRRLPFSGVYTFGQPRVGNAVFRDRYHDSGLRGLTFRVVHSADIVPHVPFLLGLYRHAGHEIFYSDSGRWREEAPFLWKAGSEAAAHLHRLTRFRAAALADHHVDTYLKLFEGPDEAVWEEAVDSFFAAYPEY
jgi:triacylglycerol lipase